MLSQAGVVETEYDNVTDVFIYFKSLNVLERVCYILPMQV